MNLEAELERVTAPAPAAGKVRQLSAEEIAELAAAGKVTPPEKIPAQHLVGSVSVPAYWRSKASYGSDSSISQE